MPDPEQPPTTTSPFPFVELTEPCARYSALFQLPTSTQDDTKTKFETMRNIAEKASRISGGPSLPMRRIEDFSVPTLDGTTHFLVRAYFPVLLEEEDDDENDQKHNNKHNQALPNSGGGLGVLLFSHGGGGVVGSIASYDTICRQIATRGQVVVLSVDYRLCPEHPYPAAQEDMEAAFHFLIHKLAPQYPQTIDLNKLVVMGDSFGGHLAASFLVRLHRKKEEEHQTKIDAYYYHWPKACILIYPAVDLTAADHNDSFMKYGHVSHLTPASVKACAQAYLRSEEGGDGKDGAGAGAGAGTGRVRQELRTHPEVSVLFAKNLQAFWPPHTLILSAECDPLLDEAVAFKHKLDIDTTNKKITHIVYPQVIHGFFSGYDFFPETEVAFQEVGRWLKECGIGGC